MVAGRGQRKCQQNSTMSISQGAARGNQGCDKRPEKQPSVGLKLGQPKTWPRSSFVSICWERFCDLCLGLNNSTSPLQENGGEEGSAWAVPCSQHSSTPNVFIQQLSTSGFHRKISDPFVFPSQFVTATSHLFPAALPGPWHCPAPELAGPHLPEAVPALLPSKPIPQAPTKPQQQL